MKENKVVISEVLRGYLAEQKSIHDKPELLLSALYCVYRWQNFSTGIMRSTTLGFSYHAIKIAAEQTDVVKAFSPLLNHHFYLLPLDDPNITAFIFELGKRLALAYALLPFR